MPPHCEHGKDAPCATKAPTVSALKRTVVEDLAALGLATIRDTIAVMTPSGRKALIRGSSRLLDVDA
jgi:hypothetical protein